MSYFLLTLTNQNHVFNKLIKAYEIMIKKYNEKIKIQ